MGGLCLTAGTGLADILWVANVLPVLRRDTPQVRLIWECPLPEIRAWMESYPELAKAVGDVEDLPEPPDDYRILHPSWYPRSTDPLPPLAAVFALAGCWCAAPRPLPERPYCPVASIDPAPPPGLPSAYICLDPHLGGEAGPSRDWVALIAELPFPAVQVGPAQTPLLPGAIDARGDEVGTRVRVIQHARLMVSGDTDSSCLAHALGKPQVWLDVSSGAWQWPRGGAPLCRLHKIETPDSLHLPVLTDLIRRMPVDGEDRP